MITRLISLSALMVLACFLVVPCVGCGSSSSQPVGVEDNSLEEFEALQNDEEYIEAEENIN